MKVRFLAPAREEFLQAVEFYEGQSSGLGAEFLIEVEEKVESLKGAPNQGAPYIDEVRRILLRRFPYNIVYLIEPDALVILAIAHQRRKPGYWKNRPR